MTSSARIATVSPVSRWRAYTPQVPARPSIIVQSASRSAMIEVSHRRRTHTSTRTRRSALRPWGQSGSLVGPCRSPGWCRATAVGQDPLPPVPGGPPAVGVGASHSRRPLCRIVRHRTRSRRAPAAGRWMRTAMTCAAIPWAADGEPADLAATRPHTERYGSSPAG